MKSRSSKKGFVLLGVLLVLVLLMTSLLVTLRDSGDSLREAGQSKYQELLDSAASDAVQKAMAGFQLMDSHTLIGVADSYNIFSFPTTAVPFQSYPYPTAGPFQNEFFVRWGFKRGQRTRAPSGEDTAGSYGYIFEVQVEVRSNTAAAGVGLVGVEQRSTVGVRIPGTYAYGQ